MNDLFLKVKNLKLPAGKYAIFGSGPIAIRGLRECKDVDIIVTRDVFIDCKTKPDWQVKKLDENTEYLDNDGIELWDRWGPGEWDINKLIQEAETIEDLPFVRLEQVLKWKEKNGRSKDLEDAKLIKTYLTAKKSVE